MPVQLPPRLKARAYAQWRASVRRGSDVTWFQLDIVDTLRALGARPDVEATTSDGMLLVGISVVWNGR